MSPVFKSPTMPQGCGKGSSSEDDPFSEVDVDGQDFLPPALPFRTASNMSALPCDSTANLIDLENGASEKQSKANRTGFPWTVFDFIRSLPNEPPRDAESRASIWQGWRLIVFGSWLNVLLLLIPISSILGLILNISHTLVFILSILSMIPLVKLHDLATHELASRLGGSRAGLLDASMSNTVELVIAISALRQCELNVVQSSLIGSILSKLLLVLGMCFFAGGLRFSEQELDQTATHVHSSLLSISTGALLLPAAYHFAMSGGKDSGSHEQKTDILDMSHGVSVVLLIIYASYLLFQLWSHPHLYKDKAKHSNKLAVKIPTERFSRLEKRFSEVSLRQRFSDAASMGGKWSVRSSKPCALSKLSPLYRSSFATSSAYGSTLDATTITDLDDVQSQARTPVVESPVDIGSSKGRRGVSKSYSMDNISVRCEADSSEHLSRLSPSPSSHASVLREPELSWTMTLCLLIIVTVAVAATAEDLVESMDGISTTISKQWIGLILLPAVSSIADIVTAVNVSFKDQLTLSVSVAVGSAIQMTLLVVPFIVILGWAMDKPLALLFDPFESVVLYISVQTMSYVTADGKSNWLDGIILMCLYVIIAVSFWFYPGSTFSSQLASCVHT